MKPKLPHTCRHDTCRTTQRNAAKLHTRLGSPVVRTCQSWDEACPMKEQVHRQITPSL